MLIYPYYVTIMPHVVIYLVKYFYVYSISVVFFRVYVCIGLTSVM